MRLTPAYLVFVHRRLHRRLQGPLIEGQHACMQNDRKSTLHSLKTPDAHKHMRVLHGALHRVCTHVCICTEQNKNYEMSKSTHAHKDSRLKLPDTISRIMTACQTCRFEMPSRCGVRSAYASSGCLKLHYIIHSVSHTQKHARSSA